MSNVETAPITDIKIFDNITVQEYNSSYREQIEDFRQKTFDEGNESLTHKKYDPDRINGQTWMTFVGNELASISVVEESHYTGDPKIAARICRYHILKKYRHSNAGFRMLPHQVEWAKKQNFKVLYWTHAVSNKALNAMYQGKKKMPMRGKEVPYFETSLYKSFILNNKMLFKVSPKSDFLQYFYVKTLEPGFIWEPKSNVIYYAHDGDITDNQEVIKNGTSLEVK